MKRAKGLWIDHRKAVIVTVTDKAEEVTEILSHVEKQLGRFEGHAQRRLILLSWFRRMIRSRETLRDISIPTTMR
jgi:hypothetical protein